MASKELLKVVVVAVVVERDDAGKVDGEIESNPLACYSPEQLASFWQTAQAEVEMFNQTHPPPNRQQRRRK